MLLNEVALKKRLTLADPGKVQGSTLEPARLDGLQTGCICVLIMSKNVVVNYTT